MKRTEALAKIAAALPHLSDERVQALAEIAHRWAYETARPLEGKATRAAIEIGIAEGRRGDFATDDEVAQTFAQFRG
jgi:predicted transcriptional regulator